MRTRHANNAKHYMAGIAIAAGLAITPCLTGCFPDSFVFTLDMPEKADVDSGTPGPGPSGASFIQEKLLDGLDKPVLVKALRNNNSTTVLIATDGTTRLYSYIYGGDAPSRRTISMLPIALPAAILVGRITGSQFSTDDKPDVLVVRKEKQNLAAFLRQLDGELSGEYAVDLGVTNYAASPENMLGDSALFISNSQERSVYTQSFFVRNNKIENIPLKFQNTKEIINIGAGDFNEKLYGDVFLLKKGEVVPVFDGQTLGSISLGSCTDPSALWAARFRMAGLPDILVSCSNGFLFIKNDPPMFQPVKPMLEIRGGSAARRIRTADLNGDMYLDVVFVDEKLPGKVFFLLSCGAPLIDCHERNKLLVETLNVPGFHRDIEVADFNNDGRVDLIVPSYADGTKGTLAFLRNLPPPPPPL